MSAAQSIAGRRRLSQAELDMIVSAHEKFVTGKQGGKRASLRFMNLSGLDLSFRNLADADFSASILDGCRMVRTRLERANLFGADLRKADLRQAVLVRADLRGACLRGANLSQADLTQADFREGQVAIPHPRKGWRPSATKPATARSTRSTSRARPWTARSSRASRPSRPISATARCAAPSCRAPTSRKPI
jgi:hypothetical protein